MLDWHVFRMSAGMSLPPGAPTQPPRGGRWSTTWKLISDTIDGFTKDRGELAAAALGLLAAARLPNVGPLALTVAVALVVPALGLAAAALLMLVGPVAAPAVWDGLGIRAVLAMLWRQLCRHLVVCSA